MDWHPQAKGILSDGDYASLIQIYEHLIEGDESVYLDYLYLGLAYLLNQQEEEAQATWLYALAQAEDIGDEGGAAELTQILSIEADRQQKLASFDTCWIIRQCLKEFAPNNLDNLFALIELSLETREFQPDLLEQFQVSDLLNADILVADIDPACLQTLLQQILQHPASATLDFALLCKKFMPLSDWEMAIVNTATRVGYFDNNYHYAIELILFSLNHCPDSLRSLEHLPRFYVKVAEFREAIAAAQRFYDSAQTLPHQFVANALLLDALLRAGDWQNLMPVVNLHENLVHQFIEQRSLDLSLGVVQSLLVKSSLFQYIADQAETTRTLVNEAAKLFCENIYAQNNFIVPFHQVPLQTSKKLKIGYIAHTLTDHSVGWLSRWLFHHHNRERFEIHIYLMGQSSQDSMFQTFFAPKVDAVVEYEKQLKTMAEHISRDQIQILVDLDSTTSDYTCTVLALKPAPVQVTWLGFDAPGLSTVDYFLADPYVLPKDAQSYYQEKIWRLPQTYIAVDGFEADVPSLHRDDLGIPADAIIFFSAQTGYKRHPETIRLQMQILKQVPGSFFLIKGVSDERATQALFKEIAQEQGVACERLRFLAQDKTCFAHRANLQIADVILDTYPYTGATTTLEALWMGIPLVTRVGKQFAARNSYAFLTNVGTTEGIASSAEEYVKWGVRYGTDEALRQKVAWQLRQSRHTSPLWDARKFTQEMENAYEQMWQIYIENVAP
jgi:predicted O-linked N-acetylglucosamine transferase (SPINDLY family)